MLKQLKVGLFLPCYNVENYLAEVLRSIPPSALEKLSSIVIVDNQSTDKTIEVALSTVQELQLKNVFILKNRQNYLLGGSTVVALRHAQEMGLDYLICMHSDGQAQGKEILKFISIMESAEYDFILGSRFLKDSQVEDYSKLRYFFNMFFVYIQQFLIGQKVYDLAAYVAFNVKTVSQVPFDRLVTDMGYPVYLILNSKYFLKRSLKIFEFPVHWGKVEVSSINPWLYGLGHLYQLICLWLKGPKLMAQAPALPTDLLLASEKS